MSVDSKYTLRAFGDRESLGLTLLSDFWPHGGFARRCGAFDTVAGRAGRGTMIVDPDGLVRRAELGGAGRARDLADWIEDTKSYGRTAGSRHAD